MELNWPRLESPYERFKTHVKGMMDQLDARESKAAAIAKKEIDGFNNVKNFITLQNQLQNDFAEVCELLGEKGYNQKLEDKYNSLIEVSIKKHERRKAQIHETRNKI